MTTSNGIIPNGNHRKEDNVVFRMSGLAVVLSTFPLPLFGFIICIVLSLVNDFVGSTYTTCNDDQAGQVPNFLPSISAAIGRSPQGYIWRICFALHLTPRFMFAVMHYHFNMGFPVTSNRAWYRRLNGLACAIHMGELCGLCLLTYISSTENYPVHEKGFLLFFFCGETYMVAILILYRWARHEINWSARDIRSYRLKIFFFASSVACACIAAYFFKRHMRYCEPNIYSWFAVFEYLLVLSNVGFHASWLFIDFTDAVLKMSIPIRPGQYSNLPV